MDKWPHVLCAVLIVLSGAANATAGTIMTATYGGHTYRLLDNPDGTKWWSDAEAEAILLGGHLVTVDDAAENLWLFQTFMPAAIAYAAERGRSGVSLWIGLSDIASEGNWVWASGAPLGYTAWAPGQPVVTPTNVEDYAGIWAIGPQWHDIFSFVNTGDFPLGVVEIESVTPVPEPSTIALVSMGALVLLRRHRARRQQP